MKIKKIGEKWVLDFRTNGRDSKRVIKKFDKKIDAQVFYEKFKEEQKKFIAIDSDEVNPLTVTLENEAKFWLDNVRFKFSASHMKRVDGILSVLLPKYGELTLSKIKPGLMNSIQQDLIGQGKARATVNRYTEVIVAIVNHSIEHRRFPYNPLSGFKKLQAANIEMNFWTMEEAASFLAFANNRYPIGSEKRWVYLVYLLAINTGLRAGEVWGLKASDLSREMRSILIRRQFNRVTKDFDVLKGKKNSNSGNAFRRVPCNPELMQEIERHLETRKLSGDVLLFSHDSKPICHDNFSKRNFAPDIEKWGGKKIRFHDLRHTAATLMVSAGVDLVTVKSIHGHSKIETTMNYLHSVSSNVSRVADSFSINPSKEVEKPRLRVVSE